MLSCSTAENQIGTSHHAGGMLLPEEKLLLSPFRLLRRSSLSQQQHNDHDDDNEELLSTNSSLLSDKSDSKKRKCVSEDKTISKKLKLSTSIPPEIIKQSVELTTTPATIIATSTKCKKKQQRFDLSCNIIHKIDRTEYEKELLWYNKEELQKMKSNAKEIVRHFIVGNLDYEFNETNEFCFYNDHFHNSVTIQSDSNDNSSIKNDTYSLLLSCSDIFEYQRGLEKYSMNDMTLYNRRCHILRSQSVVLLEQDIQRIRNKDKTNTITEDHSATRISQLYQIECIPFVKWAQCLGQADSYISKWVS